MGVITILGAVCKAAVDLFIRTLYLPERRKWEDAFDRQHCQALLTQLEASEDSGVILPSTRVSLELNEQQQQQLSEKTVDAVFIVFLELTRSVCVLVLILCSIVLILSEYNKILNRRFLFGVNYSFSALSTLSTTKMQCTYSMYTLLHSCIGCLSTRRQRALHVPTKRLVKYSNLCVSNSTTSQNTPSSDYQRHSKLNTEQMPSSICIST